MAPKPRATLNSVELERRLCANAALSTTASMSDMRAMEPADRLAAAIAGVNAERQGGRVLLTVNVTVSCPGCTVRLAGATRAVGDGVTSAMFRGPLGVRDLLVEMTDDRGRFVPVLRVELAPNGRVVRHTVLSDAADEPIVAAATHESGMAMPMTAADASMSSHLGGGNGGGAMGAPHDRMDDDHSLAAMTGHAADAQPHLGPSIAGAGETAEHMPAEPARSADRSEDSHLPESADPFADAPGVMQDITTDGGHGTAARFWPFYQSLPFAQATDEDAEAVAEIVDPTTPMPALVIADDSVAIQPTTQQGESTWGIAAGGAAVTVTLFAASRALERRARRGEQIRFFRAASLRR